jgi:predicted alpha-1,2-mannosidase
LENSVLSIHLVTFINQIDKMKKLIAVFLLFSSQIIAQQKFAPEELVNPLMGSDSKYSLSNGNTYPAIALPWGMNFWTPQTNKMGNGWQYQYSTDKIRGFKQTHEPSPWINDYGQFSIMPLINHLVFDEEKRASWFSHKTEIAKPYYYSVYLADANVTTEISPTERCTMFQFTFPAADSAFVIIDAFDKGSYIKIIPEENKIIGYTTKNSGSVPSNFKNYFVIYCDKPIQYFSVADSGKIVANSNEVKSSHAMASIGFKTIKDEQVHLKIASSFISFEQAELNYKNEVYHQSFSQILQQAKQIWHNELSKIKVEGGTDEQLKTFYSCLYRVLLFPRKFYEINQEKKIVHYSPFNGKVEQGYLFTDNGFWDTFRAVFPFFTLMFPEHDAHIMEGLVNAYKESGWLPEWASPGHRDCMIGSNSGSLITDSYLKGIRGFDISTLYEALVKNSENEGPLSSVGRKGVKLYNQLGYVPYDAGIDESAARTLEYGYADFCLAQLAKSLGKPVDEIKKFELRSQNFKILFDSSHLLMRGKNGDGSFQSPFNPFKWGDAFTEGNSWHYTWSVFHDINGLKKLMGGDGNFISMLDSVFKMPPLYDESYYGQVIHEIREMQITNMGQYAHGNQPIQHMIYLYNYSTQPWKSQYWAREVMNKLYKPTPDGYCGDEDNGQTSAWYIFSAMGFYPVCPGSNQYVLGSPLFKKITLSFASGKKFVIDCENNNSSNKYIQSANLNGKVWDNNYLNHADIINGGTLQIKMGSNPNYKRGTAQSNFPYSFTK